jgi:small-conductance mechanosensitive channel
MRALLNDPISAWSAVLVIVLPLVIVAGGEVEERLRQRGSQLTKPVTTLRTWVLGLATVWILLVLVLGIGTDNILVRIVSTAVVVSLIGAALQLMSYATTLAKQRAELPGGRGIPQLVLLLPRLLLFLVAGWLVFGAIWNVNLSGLFAALGVTSLVVSLALQPTLSSLASGLLLVGDRPFSPGDWIKFGDREGMVVDLSWRTSRIRTRNGDLLVVPNHELSESTLTNFAQPDNLHRVVVPVQVAYANPPTSAKEMLLAAARATPGVLDDPAPLIRVVQIDDPLMGYEADLWIDDYAIAPRVFSDFGSLVWYQSNRMGVPLPSPAFDLFHHDPIQEADDAEVGVEERVERIRRSPMLRDLPEGDIRRLAESAVVARFSRGERILAGGLVHRDVYVIWEGHARIEDATNQDRFLELSDGDVFGVLSRSTRNGSPPAVIAMTDCEVVIIEAEAAGAVASRNPDLSQAMNQLGVSRSRRLDPPAPSATGRLSADGVLASDTVASEANPQEGSEE